jgi:hypothetical protein
MATVELTADELELIKQALIEMKINMSSKAMTTKEEKVDALLEKLAQSKNLAARPQG